MPSLGMTPKWTGHATLEPCASWMTTQRSSMRPTPGASRPTKLVGGLLAACRCSSSVHGGPAWSEAMD